MKNGVPVLICAMLLIGGSMLMTSGAVTTSVPATYVVAANPAPPVAQGDAAQPQPPVVQQGVEIKAPIPDGLLVPKNPQPTPLTDELALMNRVGRTCPLNSSNCISTTPEANACDAVAITTEGDATRRPLRAVAQAGRGLLKVVVGHERRVARREARRGG